ncbi:unnamed protein product [Larinioides sclopetarius]|uniref:Uncharacterized protein n=1 Tax=Larinioides sclopetarius TaxID=280406 RepID=A0AAV1ZHS2_9ARAC
MHFVFSCESDLLAVQKHLKIFTLENPARCPCDARRKEVFVKNALTQNIIEI